METTSNSIGKISNRREGLHAYRQRRSTLSESLWCAQILQEKGVHAPGACHMIAPLEVKIEDIRKPKKISEAKKSCNLVNHTTALRVLRNSARQAG